MQQYRFFYIQGNLKWYLMRPTHIDAPAEFCLDLPSAGLFTEAEWLAWGNGRYEREEIGEDEAMRLFCSPMLPGMEAIEALGRMGTGGLGK